ncbi:hypothetical protein, partial [Erwinia billingiae]|uniref:hypothetical protein n=1 Tax=Erwinia billingiae TaxID=182337 RepID=UPI001A7EF4E3
PLQATDPAASLKLLYPAVGVIQSKILVNLSQIFSVEHPANWMLTLHCDLDTVSACCHFFSTHNHNALVKH